MDRRRHDKPTLVRDEDGAVLVMGVFATALLIGGLYYLFGTADAIRYREHMQDSADAGAWSMGVMHARGMNLIALLNMAKLSSVAVLVGLGAALYGAVETLSWINSSYKRSIRYAASTAVLVFLIPELVEKVNDVSGTVDDIVDAADDAQDTLGRELHAIAERRAQDIVLDGFGAPTEHVFGEAGREMPLKDGSSLDLCFQFSSYSDPLGYLGLIPAEYYSAYWPARTLLDNAADELPDSSPRRRMRNYGESVLLPLCLLRGVEAKEVSARLGSERYQLRAFAVGAEVPTWTERYVKIATVGRDDDGGRIRELRDRSGRVAWAQAEYYFDGKEDRAQLLWHMAWRARMRRYRDVDVGAFVAGCGNAGVGGGLCGQLAADVAALEKASAH